MFWRLLRLRKGRSKVRLLKPQEVPEIYQNHSPSNQDYISSGGEERRGQSRGKGRRTGKERF